MLLVLVAVSIAAYGVAFLAWGAWSVGCLIGSASLQYGENWVEGHDSENWVQCPATNAWYQKLLKSACKRFRDAHSETEPFVYKGANDFSKKYDWIKIRDPDSGSRITKLKAEIHLSGTLVVVFVVCATISFSRNDADSVGIFLLLSASAIGAYWYLSRRVRSAVMNVYKLWHKPPSMR